MASKERNKLSRSQIFWRLTGFWTLGGVALMVFLIAQFPGETFPLPKALSTLQPLAAVIGNRGTVFIAGWGTWTFCGFVSVGAIARIAERAQLPDQ